MANPQDLTKFASIKLPRSSKLGSTACMIVGFAKGDFKVPDMELNSTLASAAITYAGLSQLNEKRAALADNANARTITQEVLDKLKSVPTPVAKATYETLIRDAAPAFQEHEEIILKSEAGNKHFVETRDGIFKTLTTVLATVVNAKNPTEKAGSQVIDNQLIMAEKNRKALQAELEQLAKLRLVSDSKLSMIYQKAYDTVPSVNREGLPSTPSFAPTARR